MHSVCGAVLKDLFIKGALNYNCHDPGVATILAIAAVFFECASIDSNVSARCYHVCPVAEGCARYFCILLVTNPMD